MSAAKSDALAGDAAQGIESMAQTAKLDSATEALRVKRHATIQAQLALKGFVLQELAEGGWLITRWDRIRWLADLGEVESFLRRVGG